MSEQVVDSTEAKKKDSEDEKDIDFPGKEFYDTLNVSRSLFGVFLTIEYWWLMSHDVMRVVIGSFSFFLMLVCFNLRFPEKMVIAMIEGLPYLQDIIERQAMIVRRREEVKKMKFLKMLQSLGDVVSVKKMGDIPPELLAAMQNNECNCPKCRGKANAAAASSVKRGVKFTE